MNEYKCIKLLGKGAFGSVYLTKNIHTGENHAIKIIKKDNLHFNEVYNHALLGKHDNIVEFKKVYKSKNNVYVVMEYVDGLELFEKFKQEKILFSEEKTRYYFKKILNGLDYMHSLGICHKDLKLENIIVDNDKVKICDFGFSSSKHYRYEAETKIGSMAYCAPEVLLDHIKDEYKLDIWSLGVILFILLCGYYPFQDKKDPKNKDNHVLNIIKCNYELPNHISEECCDLLKKIFVADPDDRISLEEIMKHDWVTI